MKENYNKLFSICILLLDRLLQSDQRVLIARQPSALFARGDLAHQQTARAQPQLQQPAPAALLDQQAAGAAGLVAGREPDQATHTAPAGEGQVRQKIPHLLFVSAGAAAHNL